MALDTGNLFFIVHDSEYQLPKCISVVVHDAVEVVAVHNPLQGSRLFVELNLLAFLQTAAGK
jgi:hypothetical protein